jgi:hypothetical protein
MRLFRAVHTSAPTQQDMRSAWDRGLRPVILNAANVRAYQGVSVFVSLRQLRDKSLAFPAIGRFAAELEVPDDVVGSASPRDDGHVRLDGTTPDQLLGYVVSVRPLFPGRPPSVRK